MLSCIKVYGQWEWQNPLPQGNPILDMHLLNADTVIFVGKFGTIIKTTDGGQTLEIIESGTQLSLRSVYFPNTQVGYAVGGDFDNGNNPVEVLKTTNMGDTWNVIYNGLGGQASSIFFIDNDTGFIAGEDGLILKTIDCGKSWNKINTNTTKDIRELIFIDEYVGFAIGDSNLLLRTKDVGNKWVSVETGLLDGHVFSISFPNTETGYLLSHNFWGNVTILKTVNAGMDWTLINDGSYLPSMTFLDFLNCDTGFVYGLGIKTRTYDGGQTWQYDPDYFYLWFDGKIDFWNFNNGYCIAGSENYYYESPRIQKTENSGHDWFAITSHTSLAGLNRIEFPGSLVGYTINQSYYSGCLLKTDNGQQWNTILQVDDTAFSTFCFLDENNGLIGASCESSTGYFQRLIFKTKDGGVTWSRIIVEDSCYYFDQLNNSISYPDQSICFLTYDVKVFRSIDSCKTWHNILTDSLYNYSTIQFATKDIGYLLAYPTGKNKGSVELLKTTDMGESWESILQIIDNRAKMYFVNSDIGFILTTPSPYKLYKTTDGGNSWIANNLNIGMTIKHFQFLDEFNGYLLGNPNKLYKTNDGGLTWEFIPGITSNSLNDICFLTQDSGYLCGKHGTILFYCDLYTVVEDQSTTNISKPVIVAPNPCSSHTTIQYSLPKPSQVTIDIFDQTGRHIETVCKERQTSGLRQMQWQTEEFATGVYFYRVRVNDRIYTGKIIKMD